MRIDDQAAIMRDRQLSRRTLAARAVDLDFATCQRNDGLAALGIGEAAAGDTVGAAPPAGDARVASRAVSAAGLDHGDIARRSRDAPAGTQRLGPRAARQLVDERFRWRNAELRADGIAQMRAAQRRGAVEQRRESFPRRGKLAAGTRRLPSECRIPAPATSFTPDQLAGQRMRGIALVRIDVDARERRCCRNR